MFGSILLLVLAGLAGPLLAGTRRALAPVLLGELLAGVLVGRTGLHLLDPGRQPFPAIMALGFAMLMLQAGTEVDIASPGLRQGARRGAAAFLATAVGAVPAGLLIWRISGLGPPALLSVLLAGSSAAVAFPTIAEQALAGPAIDMLIAWITVADAVTALLVPLTLTGAGQIPRALAGDAAIIATAIAVAIAAKRLFATEIARSGRKLSKQRHWALQLRLSLVLLLALATIAELTGASLLVAGFAAGIVLRQFHNPHRLVHQLTGLASGFFVPGFFVLLGATLELGGLVSSPAAIALALLMAAGATAVHVLAALITGRAQRLPTGLLGSAQLGLPAAAATLGLQAHTLSPAAAAALVAGGCLTLIPATVGATLIGRKQSKAADGAVAAPPAATRTR